MKTFFTILHLISAVLLSLVILVQQRGSGLSAVFGGSDQVYMTKRGPEKVLATTTIVLAVLFIGLSLLLLLV